MNEQKGILELYLNARLSDKPALTILRIDKIADRWESDNQVITVEYGTEHRTREDRDWQIYSGTGNREKAILEFTSVKKLFSAGYPVLCVFLLEADNSRILLERDNTLASQDELSKIAQKTRSKRLELITRRLRIRLKLKTTRKAHLQRARF